jgi:hypothetical protein
VPSAPKKPAATTKTTVPNSCSSPIGDDCKEAAPAAMDAQPDPVYAFLTFRSIPPQGGFGYFVAV